jgi:hypothetical protein
MRPRHRASKPTIADLLAADRLGRLEADPEEAAQLVVQADRHLASAAKLVDDDPAGAYQLLYDAARKAVAGDMLAHGYRAKDRPGSHAAVVLYAEDALQSSVAGEALANFDRMRRSRNRTEYGAVELPPRQVCTDLQHAQAIVEAVKERLRIPSSG